MVAVDLGANSGRVALGEWDGDRLRLTEVKRFANVPVAAHGRLYWDPLRLYDGILEGLREAVRYASGPLSSVAVDGWGVDFALLDGHGHMLGNPVHYRDQRTEQAFAEVCRRIAPERVFRATGAQLLPINTLFQLWAMRAAAEPALGAAARMLMVPDLFHFWLCGEAAQEWTEATTTQCYDLRGADWAWGLLDELALPKQLFAPVVPSGTVLGPVRASVSEATGLSGTAVIAGASHDTASAVAAVPLVDPGAVFISSGTWSVLGAEVREPVVDERSFAAQLTNEGGPYGTFQLMSNLTGLWLLQECQRTWLLGGHAYELPELIRLARAAAPFRSLVAPNDGGFVPPGQMPARIAAACQAGGQPVPETPGQVVRCILESLALAYRSTVELIAAVSGRRPPAVHIVGGGSMNELLCQWTADATGLPVWAGPAEASEVGSLLVQAVALGELGGPEDAREVVRRSFPLVLYEPAERQPWDDASERYARLAAAGAS